MLSWQACAKTIGARHTLEIVIDPVGNLADRSAALSFFANVVITAIT